MLSAPGAAHGSSMACGGAASASTRLAYSATAASTPASTPRLSSARSVAHAPCAVPSAQQHAQHTKHTPAATSPSDSPTAMLPGLLHLRLSALGGSSVGSAAAAARLRSSVRACGLSRTAPSPETSTTGFPAPIAASLELEPPACSGPASACTSACTAQVTLSHACLGSRGLQGRVHGRGQGLWGGGGGRRSVGTAAVGLLASSTAPALTSAASAAAPAPPPLGMAPVLCGQRSRLLSTCVHASGSQPPGTPAGKKQKQQQQQQAAAGARAAPADAAAPAPADSSRGGGGAPTVRYSPLHYNIEDFCARVVLTEGEKRQRMEVIEAIRAGVRKVWPGVRSVEVQVFGSFANGLSIWNSDLDLVVTGVTAPDRLTGGYEPADRARITARLRKIADAINRNKDIDILKQQLIPRARIPILRLWTKSRVVVDVSMSDDSGPRAARYMAQQCRAFPPLKPLVMVLKMYLKACGLNEVNTGGLSSYSLTNMVIAHLQEELKAGHDISDLGETLYSFLLRYGEEYNYEKMAVSVASGGIVPKMSLGFAMESARQAALSMGSYDGAVNWNERLCVDCPLTGRDVSNGSYRINVVRDAFVQASRKLEALASGRRITDTSINYLQALFDVQSVAKRSYDPYKPYEDEYLKVIRRSGGDDEEDEDELRLSGGGTDSDGFGDDGDDSGADDLDGDYLERYPATTNSTAGTGGGGRGGQQRR